MLVHLIRSLRRVWRKEVKQVPLLQAHPRRRRPGVHQGRRQQAINSLARCPQAPRDGAGLVVAPEGTVRPHHVWGSSRRGPFHIAMQAQVPVVPIVLRNSGELMWRGDQLIKPGTVEVRVLPPVDTSSWTAGDDGEHADEVRQMFVKALADWPVEAFDDGRLTRTSGVFDGDQASAGPYSQLSEYDRPLNFGADGQMSPMDTLLWRGDSDRHHRGTLSMPDLRLRTGLGPTGRRARVG